MAKRFTYFIFYITIISSCKNQKITTPVSNTAALESKESTENVISVERGISEAEMMNLLNNCTYIDYIFHDYPFSISQETDGDIDANIAFIDYKRPVVSLIPSCKAMARKFFHIKGKIVYDVDMYLSEKCAYYIFVDRNNKPIFGNYMTPEGIQFYKNIITQTMGKSPNF